MSSVHRGPTRAPAIVAGVVNVSKATPGSLQEFLFESLTWCGRREEENKEYELTKAIHGRLLNLNLVLFEPDMPADRVEDRCVIQKTLV